MRPASEVAAEWLRRDREHMRASGVSAGEPHPMTVLNLTQLLEARDAEVREAALKDLRGVWAEAVDEFSDSSNALADWANRWFYRLNALISQVPPAPKDIEWAKRALATRSTEEPAK